MGYWLAIYRPKTKQGSVAAVVCCERHLSAANESTENDDEVGAGAHQVGGFGVDGRHLVGEAQAARVGQVLGVGAEEADEAQLAAGAVVDQQRLGVQARHVHLRAHLRRRTVLRYLDFTYFWLLFLGSRKFY